MSVAFYKTADRWFAQGLEIDVLGVGRTIHEAWNNYIDTVEVEGLERARRGTPFPRTSAEVAERAVAMQTQTYAAKRFRLLDWLPFGKPQPLANSGDETPPPSSEQTDKSPSQKAST